MKRLPRLLPVAFGWLLFGVLGAALLLLSGNRAAAQNAKPPTQLTYQGFLTDGNGVPFGNTIPLNKTVIFRIYDALTGGTIKWSSQQVVTVDKGYFSVLLGQGSAVGAEPFSADLTSVFTGPGVSDRYLELNADTTTIAPRLRFLPAPYALLAKSATELLDPITGASSLAINNGNINVGSINASGNIIGNGWITTAGNNSSSHGQGAYLEWNKDGANGMTYLLNQKGGGSGGIVFGEVSTANVITERMRIDGAGNVGIGKVSRGNKLDVLGGIEANWFVGDGQNLSSLNASQITLGTLANARTTATDGNTAGAIVARDASGGFAATTVNTANANLTGKLGIGINTANTTAALHVLTANSYPNPGISLEGSAADLMLRLKNTSANGRDWMVLSSGTGSQNGAFRIWDNTSTVDRMYIAANGFVGIGTTGPGAPLHVNGSTSLGAGNQDYFTYGGQIQRNSGSDPVSIYAGNYVMAQGFTAFSDRRIKEVAKRSNTDENLATILKLQVTDYRMVDKVRDGGRMHTGLIAQEVQSVIPGAVSMSREVIPSIYSLPATFHFNPELKSLKVTMTNAHALNKGDWVRLFADRDRVNCEVVSVPSPTEFVVGMTAAPNRLFVYGKQVDDFLAIDYNTVSIFGIGAIQELAKGARQLAGIQSRSEARIAELEQKVSKLAVLESELAEMKKLLARIGEPRKDSRPGAEAPGSELKAGTAR